MTSGGSPDSRPAATRLIQRQRRATCSSTVSPRASSRVSEPGRRRERLQHRHQQLGAEHRNQLDAERRGRSAPQAARTAGRHVVPGGLGTRFNRPGMSDFTGILDDNPGLTTPATRNTNNGNLGTAPLLMRGGNLGPPALCPSGTGHPPACRRNASTRFPTTGTGTMTIFDPDRGAVLRFVEHRLCSARSDAAPRSRFATSARAIAMPDHLQPNEFNILENGFLDEWRLAQQNLYANIGGRFRVSGDDREPTFQYFGPGTGTQPLPIMLAYFNGRTNAGDPAAYSGNSWTSTASSTSCRASEGVPLGMARMPQRRRRPAHQRAQRRPAAELLRRQSGRARRREHPRPRRLHAIQRRADAVPPASVRGTAVRRQLRHRHGERVVALFVPSAALLLRDIGGEGDVAHAVKGTFVYEIPFGQGRRFGTNMGAWMDRLIGGWQLAGTVRVQTGR